MKIDTLEEPEEISGTHDASFEPICLPKPELETESNAQTYETRCQQERPKGA